jgi:hypothetical protein
MGGGGTNTTTSTSSSAPTNKDVQATASKLAKGISTAYDTGPQVFNESLYSPVGGTTQDAWAKALGAANNPDYAGAVGGAIKDFGEIATGKRFGQNDAQYQQLRQKAIDDTLTNVGSQFTASGRFGGGSYIDKATESVGNVAAGMDMNRLAQDEARQAQAAGMLPGLFSAAQQPATITGAIGSAQDANEQGILQGRADLQQRQANGWTDLIAKLTSAGAGNAASSGMTTTNTQTTPTAPWWQQALGYVAGNAGQAMRMM